jgi:hypothetical protein
MAHTLRYGNFRRPRRPTIPTGFFNNQKKNEKKLRNQKVAHIFATD